MRLLSDQPVSRRWSQSRRESDSAVMLALVLSYVFALVFIAGCLLAWVLLR